MLTFHHVGVITTDLDTSSLFYQSLGYKKTVAVTDEIQLAEIVLLESQSGPMIELIRPLNEQSPAYTWIERIKSGPFHTCYECHDIEIQIEQFRSQTLIPVSEPAPAIAFENRNIVFLWGRHTGLIELLEKEKGN